MQQEKDKALSDYPIPQTLQEVKSFVCFAGYYRRFISNFSHVVHPMTELLKKGKSLNGEKLSKRATRN